jgi:hypothetical protein
MRGPFQVTWDERKPFGACTLGNTRAFISLWISPLAGRRTCAEDHLAGRACSAMTAAHGATVTRAPDPHGEQARRLNDPRVGTDRGTIGHFFVKYFTFTCP